MCHSVSSFICYSGVLHVGKVYMPSEVIKSEFDALLAELDRNGRVLGHGACAVTKRISIGMQQELGVTDLGVSVTTLEEVFLRVAGEENEADEADGIGHQFP